MVTEDREQVPQPCQHHLGRFGRRDVFRPQEYALCVVMFLVAFLFVTIATGGLRTARITQSSVGRKPSSGWVTRTTTTTSTTHTHATPTTASSTPTRLPPHSKATITATSNTITVTKRHTATSHKTPTSKESSTRKNVSKYTLTKTTSTKPFTTLNSTTQTNTTRPRTTTKVKTTSRTTNRYTTPAKNNTSKIKTPQTTREKTTATVPRYIVPVTQRPGKDKHKGPLPTDVRVTRYGLTQTLNGAALGPGSKVTGRMEALLKCIKATTKIILKADAATIRRLRMAVLDASTPSGRPSIGLPIATVSSSDVFLIVRMKAPLVAGRAYALVIEYDYAGATTNGPLTLKEDFGHLSMRAGEAHTVFPCFDEVGRVAAMQLILRAPEGLSAISNSALDGQPSEERGVVVFRFVDTLPMPLEELAWVLISDTWNHYPIVPGVVTQYAHQENIILKEHGRRSFQFLEQCLQTTEEKVVYKLDFLVGTVEEERLGFVMLRNVNKRSICMAVAGQWFRHVLRQPENPTWFATAGAEYLCLLAETDDAAMFSALKTYLMKCVSSSADKATMGLMAFRMVHFILGDARMKTMLKNFVKKEKFKAVTTDRQLSAFEPDLPKERLQPWLSYCCKTVTVERAVGHSSGFKVTWDVPDAGNVKATPFATGGTGVAVNLRTPDPVNVTWLDPDHAEADVTVDDHHPLLVNPAMMACYGIRLAVKEWALAGHAMQAIRPDIVTAWYLLHESQKQYGTVKGSGDIAAAMWPWEALRYGDLDLWDAFTDQVVATEKEAFYLWLTPAQEKAHKERIKAVIDKRIKAIDASSQLGPDSNKGSSAVKLAALSCRVNHPQCATFVSSAAEGQITAGFEKRVAAVTSVAPIAVACYLGSTITSEKQFTALAQGAGAPLNMVLGCAVCVPPGAMQSGINKVVTGALKADWESFEVRTSHEFRAGILLPLGVYVRSGAASRAVHHRHGFPTGKDGYAKSNQRARSAQGAPPKKTATERPPITLTKAELRLVLKDAAVARAVRTRKELQTIKQRAKKYGIGAHDKLIMDLARGVVANPAPLQRWLKNAP